MTLTPFRLDGQAMSGATAPSSGYGFDVDTTTGIPFVIDSAGVKTQLGGLSTEQIQDMIGSTFIVDSTDLDFTYDDAGNALSATIKSNAVTDALLRTGAARSVIGRAGATSGNVADIAASADDTLLGRRGGSLSFAALSDAEHGNRGGSGLHAVAVAGGANGFMLGSDKTKLDGIASGATVFTVEMAQDAVGAALVDTPSVDFTYDDPGNTISAVVRLPYAGAYAGASKTYDGVADHGRFWERSNGGAAMTDTLPALSAGDNGYTVAVHNIGTVPAETVTFNTVGGTTVIGTGSSTTYVLNYGCRQTFIWTGTKWLFGAGNANLTRISGTFTAGRLLSVIDSTGRVVQDSGISTASLLNARRGMVNVLDYGADPSGATASDTAITAAVAALAPTGGIVLFPQGTYLTSSSPLVVSGDQVELRGQGPGVTTFKTNSTTGDQLRITGYGSGITNCQLQGPGSGTTSSKTAGIGLDIQGTEGYAENVQTAYQYDSIRIGGALVDVRSIICRYFKANGIVVDHQSDHRITTVLMVNNAATLPTGAGIDARVTASLVLEQLNIIASNFALNISPATGVTIPSVKATDCFFDTSACGLNMQGAGSVLRSEFTNCWFSSQTIAGIRMDPAVGGAVDGITFVNCDVYNNVGGTTNGVIAGTRVGKWKMVGCSIAGWTNGISLTAGASHFPTLLGNTIGAVSAFGVNGTGIAIAAGAYKGLTIQTNDMADNTAVIADAGATTTASPKTIAGNTPFLQPGLGSVLTANSAALTTADTSVLTFPLPANCLQVGTVFRIRAQATNSSTGVPTLKVHLGAAGTTADATVVSVATGGNTAQVTLEAEVTIRAVGAGTGVAQGAGLAMSIAAPAATAYNTNAPVTTVNTTVANTLMLSAATSAGTLIFTTAFIEVVRG